ncbi:hypothetical protein CEXT_81881 [Caerostris extrusa]|uniref:Uncharacterized protein n=1 Tax=Caerostris extrusa TaxID=172846 RepID=A0AAV4NLA6_CAEEX|nr:hypothetical protein CEXT_81881 [Caerostris extrusa]
MRFADRTRYDYLMWTSPRLRWCGIYPLTALLTAHGKYFFMVRVIAGRNSVLSIRFRSYKDPLCQERCCPYKLQMMRLRFRSEIYKRVIFFNSPVAIGNSVLSIHFRSHKRSFVARKMLSFTSCRCYGSDFDLGIQRSNLLRFSCRNRVNMKSVYRCGPVVRFASACLGLDWELY